MTKCAYFIYGEHASGIINSQAVDVVKFYNSSGLANCSLIAFLPYPFALKTHAQLEEFIGHSLNKTRALPQRFWPLLLKWESIRLAWKIKKGEINTIICRGAFSTIIALETKNRFYKSLRVCYDGRGAVAAEHEEYGVYPHYLVPLMYESEKRSVLESDTRIAVTKNLVQYWRNRYGYRSTNHQIIPTTLDSSIILENQPEFISVNRIKNREKLNVRAEEVLLVYCGSSAGWQSFGLLFEYLNKCLSEQDNIKVLLLTQEHSLISELSLKFPGRVIRRFVKPNEVCNWLVTGDYGLLIREQSITNNCASPTKYAEYLRAGLKVITRYNLSEFSPKKLSNNYIDNILDNYNIDGVKEYSKEHHKSEYSKICS